MTVYHVLFVPTDDLVQNQIQQTQVGWQHPHVPDGSLFGSPRDQQHAHALLQSLLDKHTHGKLQRVNAMFMSILLDISTKIYTAWVCSRRDHACHASVYIGYMNVVRQCSA